MISVTRMHPHKLQKSNILVDLHQTTNVLLKIRQPIVINHFRRTVHALKIVALLVEKADTFIFLSQFTFLAYVMET